MNIMSQPLGTAFYQLASKMQEAPEVPEVSSLLQLNNSSKNSTTSLRESLLPFLPSFCSFLEQRVMIWRGSSHLVVIRQ